MKKFKVLFLASIMIMSFGAISYARSRSITAENNIEMTKEKHYPVINITNNKDIDLTVEWGAYGDVYQGSIKVPAKKTVTLELKQLGFLGEKTTRVWLTWNEKEFLKPQGTDVDTIPFEKQPAVELGMKY